MKSVNKFVNTKNNVYEMGKISSFLIKRKYIAEKYQFVKKKNGYIFMCIMCTFKYAMCIKLFKMM